MSEGFLRRETGGGVEKRRYLYVSFDVFRDPAATRIHGNNEASSHASQIPATRAFLQKLDGLPFGLEPVFVHSALFYRRSDFGRAFGTHSPTNTLRIYNVERCPWSRISPRDKVVEPDMRSGFVASEQTDRWLWMPTIPDRMDLVARPRPYRPTTRYEPQWEPSDRRADFRWPRPGTTQMSDGYSWISLGHSNVSPIATVLDIYCQYLLPWEVIFYIWIVIITM